MPFQEKKLSVQRIGSKKKITLPYLNSGEYYENNEIWVSKNAYKGMYFLCLEDGESDGCFLGGVLSDNYTCIEEWGSLINFDRRKKLEGLFLYAFERVHT